jgi:hypothetical protein
MSDGLTPTGWCTCCDPPKLIDALRAALAAEPAPDPRDEALRAAITLLENLRDHHVYVAVAGIPDDARLTPRRINAALARLRAGRGDGG